VKRPPREATFTARRLVSYAEPRSIASPGSFAHADLVGHRHPGHIDRIRAQRVKLGGSRRWWRICRPLGPLASSPIDFDDARVVMNLQAAMPTLAATDMRTDSA
jgi:hypothetical protein